MKKILFFLAIATIFFSIGCDDDKSSKSEISVSTTVSDDSNQIVRKEFFAIKENVDGKSVDLKSENGVITQLAIDGKTIAKEDFKKYETLTSPILKKLPTPPSTPNDSDSEIEIDEILKAALKKDGFISESNGKYDFDLSNDNLIINGKTLSTEKKNEYLELFKNATKKELGSKFHIKLQEDKK